MRLRPLVLVIMLLTAALPLRAQWSGRAYFSTGIGGMMGREDLDIGFLGHVVTQGDVSLLYKTDKFSWNTTVGGSWEAKSSDNSRLNMNLPQPDELGLEVVYKTVKTRPMQISIRSDFGWTPSASSNYSAWISYRYRNDAARNVSNSLSGTMPVSEAQIRHYHATPRDLIDELRLDGMDSFLASCYYETPRLNEHAASAGARGQWILDSRNTIQSSVSLATTDSRKHTVWSVFKTADSAASDIDAEDAFRRGDAWMYRITPSSFDMDFSADCSLRHIVRKDSVQLSWSPGVRLYGNHSLDYNSGATLSDIAPDGSYSWRDSLRLRENFNFLAINAAPFVAADYHYKNLDIHADYALQFYLCRLNDDSRRQPLKLQSISPAGGSSFTWKISNVHRLGVTHNVGADYPDYLKICWYDRTGGYIDQLFRGNEDLKSTLWSSYGMTYELRHKHFLYRTTNALTRRINEIDQTWTNEEIEGRLYKVFHWVNSADSWSFGTTHRVGWAGKWLTANAGVGYNQSRRTSTADGSVRNSSDWNLSADATANLGKGWQIGADALYQSSVATFFTKFNEYWVLNARVQKQFKKVLLWFDARDLLDHARQTTFESADSQELWVDVARDNRRLFRLGVQWSF